MAEPNENILHVEAIEGLVGEIGMHLGKLVETNPGQADAKWKATEYLKNYQINQLKTLRDKFID